MAFHDVVATHSSFQQVAQDGSLQVERVVGDHLGDVARLVFHQHVVILLHLCSSRLRFHGLLEGRIRRGIDKRGDVLQHEVQCVECHLGLHLVEDVGDIVA